MLLPGCRVWLRGDRPSIGREGRRGGDKSPVLSSASSSAPPFPPCPNTVDDDDDDAGGQGSNSGLCEKKAASITLFLTFFIQFAAIRFRETGIERGRSPRAEATTTTNAEGLFLLLPRDADVFSANILFSLSLSGHSDDDDDVRYLFPFFFFIFKQENRSRSLIFKERYAERAG